MKKTLFVLTLAVLASLSPVAVQAAPETKEEAKKAPAPVTTTKSAFPNDVDRLSYAIGMNIGQNLSSGIKSGEIKINLPVLCQAMKDMIEGKTPAMTEEEVRETFMNLRKEVMAKQQEQARKNLAAGEKFLAENAKKPNIKSTESGLQYKVIKKGDGPIPKATDRVKVHYKGTLLDGKEFDSSHKRGQPATFPVTGVIPGWTEALKLMPVGSKWQVFIPSKLGYGEHGAPPNIPGNAVLIFEMELLSIEPAPTTAPQAPTLNLQPPG